MTNLPSLPDFEIGPKMQACSERERKFVVCYVFNDDGNASEAARLAGYADPGPGSSAIRVQAHALMHRARVKDAIEEVARLKFRSLLVPTINATKRLIEKSDHPDHAGTVKSMLSRLGFGEKTGVDVNISGEVVVNHTDAALNDLRALKALGLPRERLQEIFGFSGLDRYERMLAVTDARQPAIEGEFKEVENAEPRPE